MNVTLASTQAAQHSSDCLVIAVFEGKKLSATAKQLDQACSGGISRLLKRGDLEGKCGQTLLLHELDGILSPRVLLVGCGKEKNISLTALKTIVRTVTQQIAATNIKEATYYLTDITIKGSGTIGAKAA